MIQKAVTLVAQIIACLLLLSFTFIAVPVGNGWELLVLAIFYTIGVSAVGWGVARLFKTTVALTPRKMLIILLCSGLGAALLAIPGVLGLGAYLLPAVGAIIGYHILHWNETG